MLGALGSPVVVLGRCGSLLGVLGLLGMSWSLQEGFGCPHTALGALGSLVRMGPVLQPILSLFFLPPGLEGPVLGLVGLLGQRYLVGFLMPLLEQLWAWVWGMTSFQIQLLDCRILP